MMGSLLVQSVGQASHRLRVFKFLPTGNIMEMLTFWWPFLYPVIHIYFIVGEGRNNKLGGKGNGPAVQSKIYINASAFK